MPLIPCWESLECDKWADCPAYPDNGWNCWDVDGTLCFDGVQCVEHKPEFCRERCAYYRSVIHGLGLFQAV
jgi:hypothetical protein